MMRGKVNHRGQPRVAVELLGRYGWSSTIDFVLDTGFGGDLLLPSEVIRRLEVTEDDQVQGALANGQGVRLPSWRGVATWHNRPVSVVILEADGEPLLGRNLLRGSRVTLDMEVDGEVTIDELER